MIKVAIGGPRGKVVFGDLTTGASAISAVDADRAAHGREWGDEREAGLLPCSRTRLLSTRGRLLQRTRELFDDEVRRIVDEGTQCDRLLREERERLDALAETLLERRRSTR